MATRTRFVVSATPLLVLTGARQFRAAASPPPKVTWPSSRNGGAKYRAGCGTIARDAGGESVPISRVRCHSRRTCLPHSKRRPQPRKLILQSRPRLLPVDEGELANALKSRSL